MVDILPINNTLELLCSCWNTAESSLQKEIMERFPDEDEVMITKLFAANLREAIEPENKKNAFSTAFRKDLHKSYPNIELSDSQQISSGLIAEVKFHKPALERKTGGDLGFVIQRPNLYLQNPYAASSDIIIDPQYQRGILTQAKLKNVKGKWRRFTKNQRKILPLRKDFLALLLYSYREQDPIRSHLEPFRWQLCEEYPFNDDSNDWLRRGKFPKTFDSSQMIKKLGNAEIGTADKQKIDEYICPVKDRKLIINIHRSDGKPPFPSCVRIRLNEKQKQLARPMKN
jgi:hypothetical protein